ncbi:MAG: hypothetical protein COW24_06000 [Candidatus Kerfeldbacteria bacterium CG15_BIG_FIL_POST_REV_8_21_14_020_45_12]|uniref:Bacterial sugar transferase domain-containing protein n=1 Tax=Candidatus Kerfeldbacteria bacterium CG15_BIG_FIL_POST_REV_8_21_14_020_45_12 TaxID=2014247 RepID=A0A2M7H2B6_9BACT|nr:MAG: hypothetical protein COW24_06000 [Candidatus Kerfeldbacteria bacterium CG15_BIG_FIL_POST_REV_8_21_14_020_45_12]PJA92991.1 MAG: hypothetical protein CO132_05250 [Candidatus Kerfeldbacteria bacterium CG_4_9_14_3_um_filter_45_8]
MKRAELLFGAILVPVDYLMLVLAGVTAYFFRFYAELGFIPDVVYRISFEQYVLIVLLTAVVWLVVFAFTGLYNIRGTRRIVEEVRKILLACSTGVLIIIVLFFLDRDLFSSRFIILAAYLFAIAYVTIARLIVLSIERQLFAHGVGVNFVAVIGEGHVASVIVHELKQRTSLGFVVQRTYSRFTDEVKAELAELIAAEKIDEIIKADPDLSTEKSEEIFEFCNEHHIIFKYAAALSDAQQANLSIRPIGGIPVIEVERTRLDGWGRIAKRLFDIIGSLILIIVSSPLMLITALAIVIESGFPVVFSRRDDDSPVMRVGQNGKKFRYYKFRSMKPGTDSQRYSEELQDNNLRKGSPLVKIKDDPRITRVGRVIRRLSLDELPEFLLVLKGDMSLVGPRPHLPEEVAKYHKHHKRVLNIKPGITGMAQVSGRSDLDFEDEVRLDTVYMEKWSLLLDLIILLKTPLIVLRKRKAL